MRRPSSKYMQMVGSSSIGGRLAKISSAFYAELPHHLIAKSLHGTGQAIDYRKVIDNAEHINDGLCEDAGNRRAADVVHSHHALPQGGLNTKRFRLERFRPRWIVWNNKCDHERFLAPQAQWHNGSFVPPSRRLASRTVGQIWLTFGVEMPDGQDRQAQ